MCLAFMREGETDGIHFGFRRKKDSWYGARIGREERGAAHSRGFGADGGNGGAARRADDFRRAEDDGHPDDAGLPDSP